MSIKVANERAVKRQKMSHSTTDTGTILRNGTTSSSKMDQHAAATATTFQSSAIKSSLMAIQVQELLEITRSASNSNLRKTELLLERISEVIESEPETTPQPLALVEKSLYKHNIHIPFAGNRPASDVKYQFQYQPPQSVVRLHGETPDTHSNSDSTSELTVQMPHSVFQEKDYLNHRALHKRAYYLAYLAQNLKKDLGHDFSYQYAFKDGNTLMPLLCITPKDSKNSSSVYVNVAFPFQVGPIDKTLPTKSCLRSAEVSTPSGISSLPTPFYNSTVRTLSSVSTMSRQIDDATKKCEAFKDACLLGSTWLRQRGFDSSLSGGGFGGNEWSVVCASLLSAGGHKGQPLFSPRYSSMQLFKAMLQVLSGRDLKEKPMLINTTTSEISEASYPIFYDGSTGVNILYKMNPWSYRALMRHSQLSLDAANARYQDNFDPLFTTNVADPALDFDQIWSLNVSNIALRSFESQYDGIVRLHQVMERGLGDRVSAVHIKEPASSRWELNKAGPKHSTGSSSNIRICLLVDPANIDRTIDHGPSVEEQQEAKDFRSFWGEKSELRRFRDGSITETLVWSAETSISLQIMQYLAAYHFQIPPSSFEPKNRDLVQDFVSTQILVKAANAYDVINSKYQELSSRLHQLEGLPLPIRTVSLADPALRSACVGHPLSPEMARPINMIVQFDSSARWPDNLSAIQYTKIAFLAKLAELLTEADSSLDTRIGTENAETSGTGYLNTSFLDIIFSSPAPGLTPIVFRLRVHHDREQLLLQSSMNSATGPTREMLSSALIEHKREFIASTTHTGAVRNLITHFLPLSATISLLKTWIAHHMLTNQVSPEALEIIAAYVFLQPAPWSVPGSATTAFLRCIHFLAHWDWTSKPLKVDLSLGQDMTPATHQEIDTRYIAWKKLDPAMNNVAWFIGTNVDPTGTIWTQGSHPPKVVASRITALAKAAISLIQNKSITNTTDTDWKSLFVSPLHDFDFIIHLKKSVVRGGGRTNNTFTTATSTAAASSSKTHDIQKFKNLQIQQDLDVDSVSDDLVPLYLRDLEAGFGNAVLFFHGGNGGGVNGAAVIAGLWRPNVVGGVKAWRVRLGWSSRLVMSGDGGDGKDENSGGEGEEMKCVVNKEAMLADMALLGEGMVERITVK